MAGDLSLPGRGRGRGDLGQLRGPARGRQRVVRRLRVVGREGIVRRLRVVGRDRDAGGLSDPGEQPGDPRLGLSRLVRGGPLRGRAVQLDL